MYSLPRALCTGPFCCGSQCIVIDLLLPITVVDPPMKEIQEERTQKKTSQIEEVLQEKCSEFEAQHEKQDLKERYTRLEEQLQQQKQQHTRLEQQLRQERQKAAEEKQQLLAQGWSSRPLNWGRRWPKRDKTQLK